MLWKHFLIPEPATLPNCLSFTQYSWKNVHGYCRYIYLCWNEILPGAIYTVAWRHSYWINFIEFGQNHSFYDGHYTECNIAKLFPEFLMKLQSFYVLIFNTKLSNQRRLFMIKSKASCVVLFFWYPPWGNVKHQTRTKVIGFQSCRKKKFEYCT